MPRWVWEKVLCAFSHINDRTDENKRKGLGNIDERFLIFLFTLITSDKLHLKYMSPNIHIHPHPNTHIR